MAVMDYREPTIQGMAIPSSKGVVKPAMTPTAPVSNDWMETKSGLQFSPFDDEPQYTREDMVWGCARMCRFAGQLKDSIEHYSVAEHLVLMTRWAMDLPDVFWAAYTPGYQEVCIRAVAYHDMPEGLIGDMVRPLKRQDVFYQSMEAVFAAKVGKRFDAQIEPMPDLVKQWDNRILVDERRQAMGDSGLSWYTDVLAPLGVELQFWSPRRAATELALLLDELDFRADKK